MAEQDKPADAIPHVAAQQERERIAHEEKKRHAETTAALLRQRYGVE